MKLLIAEDDLASRTMLEAITRAWGYEPVVVEDGEAAWQVMQKQEPPKLLLLDWMMPGLDGLALCRRIRQQIKNNPPFIILLTARGEIADVVTGLESGANDYVAKPFVSAVLKARLQVGCRTVDLQTQLHTAAQALIYQASHDDMTGLLNRRAVMEALDKEMARSQRQAQPLCIGMFDIDHFKQINDTYGHLSGDAVLQEVVRRMKSVLRPHDYLGRYGGEEFLTVQITAESQADSVFERIRRAVAVTPIIVEQIELKVTISCGVALFNPPHDDRGSTALLAEADRALYCAKEGGRNRTVFAFAEELIRFRGLPG